MTTFGVDLSQHLAETGTQVPHLLAKCINEIDTRGIQIKVPPTPFYFISFSFSCQRLGRFGAQRPVLVRILF
jgi:hypothetical protein